MLTLCYIDKNYSPVEVVITKFFDSELLFFVKKIVYVLIIVKSFYIYTVVKPHLRITT
ncbi:protein of unknown function [Tenacibaculum jejuense]|uniref:Uncharacterized protein n=1 Tax=Tenacibaculum jejuense TaxID=584609 RepID=A0A238UA70_9FLAO|nr:protein of unknown function [Tenacibaculum jejuense]